LVLQVLDLGPKCLRSVDCVAAAFDEVRYLIEFLDEFLIGHKVFLLEGLVAEVRGIRSDGELVN
jgi:hypothetical protein